MLKKQDIISQKRIKSRLHFTRFGPGLDTKPVISEEIKLNIIKQKKIIRKGDGITQPNINIHNTLTDMKNVKIPEKKKKEIGVYKPNLKKGNTTSVSKEKFEKIKKEILKEKSYEYYNIKVQEILKQFSKYEFLEEFGIDIYDDEYELWKIAYYNKPLYIRILKRLNKESNLRIISELETKLELNKKPNKIISSTYVPPSHRNLKPGELYTEVKYQVKINNFDNSSEDIQEILKELCSKYGYVKYVKIPVFRKGNNRGKLRDFAFISFTTQNEVNECVKGLNKYKLDNMILNVEHCKK